MYRFTEDSLHVHNLFIINWYSYLSSKGTACMQSLLDQIINNWLHFTKRLLVKFHRAYKSNDRLLDLHLLHQNIYKFCLQVPALY